MELQTKIKIRQEKENPINYNASLFLLGSCFSESIGNKLEYYKFTSNQNPFGILFHPKAIESLILNASENKIYSEKDVFFHNERWHSYEAHSNLSNPNKEKLIESLNNNILSTKKYLQTSTHLIITLGTAWVYKESASNTTVANCHKIPQKYFTKEILSIDEIVKVLNNIIDVVKSINPKKTILFTVSPVRHIKDGFIENQQSKSHLLAAIHQVINSYKNTHYFPSYEIMMDELRDYRFYKEDMIHPNNLAVNYIWNRFKETWFCESTNKTLIEVENIQRDLNHRPFNENSEQHQKFLKKLEIKKGNLQKRLPHITF